MGERHAVRLMRRGGAVLFAIWAGIWAILGGFVVGTLFVLPFAAVPRGQRERYTIGGAALWARWVLAVLAVRTEVTGDAELQPGEGALVFCNHRSWLDPVLLIRYTRSNGLSKQEIFYIPAVGMFGWLAGAVFFDRTDKHQRQRARDEVQFLVSSGFRIQVFPEGTRARDGVLREKVYLRLAMDCWPLGVPVVPCALLGTEDVLPVGRFEAWPGQRVRLDIGRALRPADYPDARRFAQACWDDVVARVGRLTAHAAESPERGSNPHSREGRGF